MVLTTLTSSPETKQRRSMLMSFFLAMFLFLSFTCYVWLRVQQSLRIHEPRVSFGDTRDYFSVASEPLF
jgi:hypothetical protein